MRTKVYTLFVGGGRFPAVSARRGNVGSVDISLILSRPMLKAESVLGTLLIVVTLTSVSGTKPSSEDMKHPIHVALVKNSWVSNKWS